MGSPSADSVRPPAKPEGVSPRGTAASWILILAGAVVATLSMIDLWAEVRFSLTGEHEAGTVVATEGGSNRQRTIVAQVRVVPRQERPLSVELRDTFGSRGWKEGDTVGVLCTHIHADHLSCVEDRWLARYPYPLIALTIGLAMVGVGRASRR